MKDELVSCEMAKLAKEKGFDELTKEWDQHGNGISGRVTGKLDFYNRRGDFYISVPTQSLLQKWLREVHNLHISIQHWNAEWKFDIQLISHCLNGISIEGFTSFEDALESGLQESLKLIK